MFFGICKVSLVIALDFMLVYSLCENVHAALIAAGGILIYVLFGGYLALWREGAIRLKRLPLFQRTRLESVRARLIADVRTHSGRDISRMRFYLVPGDSDMNATAYGCRCVSVTRGTFENADPLTMCSVLAHEISHIRRCDPEFMRAMFATVTLIVAAISILSAATAVVIFLFFMILSFFRSWVGVLAYTGTRKVICGLFRLIQRGFVMTYHVILGLMSRAAEYRCDRYACDLGYGIQLSHFLALADPGGQHQLSITEAIYRSHPSTERRIARIERRLQLSAGRRPMSPQPGFRVCR